MADERSYEFALGEEVNQDEENSVDGEEMEEEVGDNDEFMADNEVRAEESSAEGEARALDEIGEDQEEDDDDDDDDYDDDDEEEERLVENEGGTASVSLGNNGMPLDRLSALPILLLFNILSRLDTREGLITSVLSKRWKHLWLFVPRLKFSYSSVDTEKISRFLAAINRTIIIYNARFLSCFEVEFTYHDCFSTDVFAWIVHAYKNEVEEFNLLLNPSPRKDLYRLPELLFEHTSLEALRLRRCIMAPKSAIKWHSLGSLFLEEIELPQHVIENLLAGCPHLCNCVLRACWGFNHVAADSQKLESLRIGDSKDGNKDPLLEISAPFAEYLLVLPYPEGRKWRITNIPSAVKAHFDFVGSGWDAGSVGVMSNAKDLLESLRHVNELRLGCECMQVLSMLAMNGWELPQSDRRVLQVSTSCNEESISGIACLLDSSPYVETLGIDGYKPKKLWWFYCVMGFLDNGRVTCRCKA
ncbi:unnamed protein product [Cuscuta campestris]|uniref:F-box domain-containing protein n=1 Tax=Cuscuta campestris TaxID=132261 RepID=A0A484LC37_9ASTE|nr:unnamed protein product [Cuscuta campestris]